MIVEEMEVILDKMKAIEGKDSSNNLWLVLCQHVPLFTAISLRLFASPSSVFLFLLCGPNVPASIERGYLSMRC